MARLDFHAALAAIKEALLKRPTESVVSGEPPRPPATPTLSPASPPSAFSKAPLQPPAVPVRTKSVGPRRGPKVRGPQRTGLTRGDPKAFEAFGPVRQTELPAKSLGPAELTGDAALRYVREHVPARDIRVFPGPPPNMDEGTRQEMSHALAMGETLLQGHAEPDEVGFIVGFDFGTSSAKVVLHQLSAGDPAYALPVPTALRASDGQRPQEHLWRSTVWFEPETQIFSLWPVDGAIAIEGFKTGLIGNVAHRMEAAAVTHAQAAAAFLALMVAYVLGQHRLAGPVGFDRAQHYGRFHFGLPVACKDDHACVADFKKVFRAAFALAPNAGTLSLASVRTALEAANPAAPTTTETPFLVFEELSAVIAGYQRSTSKRSGPHVVVDVGASTLDVATFYIPEAEGRVPVYMSGVELLGAEALAAARRAEVPDPTFRQACIGLTRRVWINTSRRKNADFLPQNGVPKPLLFVGGGRLTDLHQALYQNYRNGLGGPIETPLPGRNVLYDRDTDFARLLVAWGLSQQEPDLPVLRPPSQVEDEVRRERSWQDRYIDKDMV